jgi:enoyl-CoA hydratase/carnithine racemase
MYEDIRYETAEGIATITIDRPEVYNAFRGQTLQELNDALRAVDDDDGVYAAVLTGTDPGFCTGADTTEIPDWDDMGKEDYAGFLWMVQNVVRQLRRGPKPVVAAVNGPAVGAGSDFALACDIRVLAPDAFLREGFVRIGLISGDGGGWMLPRLIGESKAREYLLTGRDIPAEEAEDVGLAAEVAEDPVGAATDFAAEMRDLPATAVRNTKKLLDPSLSFEDYCERAIEYQWQCVEDPEQDAALEAFGTDDSPEYDREYS